MATQLAMDGGNAAETHKRLADQPYYLTQFDITVILLAVPASESDPSDFLQLEVALERESTYCGLLDPNPWQRMSGLRDLLESPGAPLAVEARELVRPAAYRLERAIHVPSWLAEADRLEAERRDKVRDRIWKVTARTPAGDQVTHKSEDEMFPGWDRFPASHRRVFDDWARSSAGQNARFCDHWSLDLGDWTSAAGERSMTLIPQWTFRQRIAEVDAGKGTDYEFYGNLQNLDRRVGVPFGWFFFMLHGNRVTSDAGERVISAAEAGLVVLPERDYRVLKDWQEAPYGF